ncbi:S-layer homology domain-containing protein [Paenibacillaceae bacterium WGS1546]|uniref:S-layer homology domain-containing protein n=1 Tax=Cohnella sp. WGS1546 TaxID=3366810 RepID=UPI00372D2ABF
MTKRWTGGRRLFNLAMCISLALGLLGGTGAPGKASAASEGAGAFSDTKGHWADSTLRKWKDGKLTKGYPDGSFRPGQAMTRAEFVKLVNGIFGFSSAGSASFSDVEAGRWHAPEVAAAVEAGYIAGYPGNLFKPDAIISRQEAAKIVAGLFKLPPAGPDALLKYRDRADIAGFARESLAQLASGQYLQGFTDGTIRPAAELSRAEAIVLLDRLAPHVIREAGVVAGLNAAGNVIVSAAGVKLKDSTVAGDLLLTAGIGEGDAGLESVNVEGTTHVNGGGANSVIFRDSHLNEVHIDKKKSPVRVVFAGKSSAASVRVDSEAIVETGEETDVDAFTVGESGKGTKLNGEEVKPGESFRIRGGKLEANGTDTEGSGGNAGGIGGGGSGGNSGGNNGGRTMWRLVWSDEFNGGGDADENGLDRSKWDYQLGTGAEYGLVGWGNNEQQYYKKENVKVENGKLTITALDDGYGGMPYTSGRLWTKPNFSKAYGKFEAKIKLPLGQGLWPAFWMMPADDEYGGWAASGEIDIMEAKGRLPDRIGGALHYGRGWPGNKYTAKDYQFPQGQNITGEHVYGLEWEPGEIRWYVDGQLYQTVNNWDSTGVDQPAKYAFPAPFDKPFYLILNLAVGGTFDGGLTPDPSDLPAKMEVDYVRVYELVGRPYKTPAEPSIEQEPLPNDYKRPIEGNYVHDPSYDRGFKTITEADEPLDPNDWNFVRIGSFGGNGTIGTETIAGTTFAKTDILEAGHELHSVQLIQNVTLGKGRWYKLTFDAKSSANRDLAVKLGGGADRGWVVYSDQMTAKLTAEIQSYAMTFQMAADTDVLARLEFNMGLHANPVWIGNVKLEEVVAPDPYAEDAPKQPLAGNHIYNGTFDLGRMDRMTYWQFEASGGASATASVDPAERQLKASIRTGGSSTESIRLWQPGIQLLQPNDYRLTFRAKADRARAIEVAVRK